MKTIENDIDFLKWAQEINMGVTISRKCDLQDVYGHSRQSTIDKLFCSDVADRKLLACSINNCMGYHEVERLLVVLSRVKCNLMIAEEQEAIDNKWNEIEREKAELLESKRAIYRRINTLERKCNRLQLLADSFKAVCSEERNKAAEYRSKSKKYDKIKSLLGIDI